MSKKTKKVKKLEKSLKRQQRRLSRKCESSKKQNKNKKEGTATRQNIQKQRLKVQVLHQKLTNIRTDYINKVVSTLVKTKPEYITLEDLNIRGMMKNKHLSKAISKQSFHLFKTKIEAKAKEHGVQVRIVSRFFPSSKLCSRCGFKKKNLKLSDRVYKCDDCNYEIDRDKNASINLKNAKEYAIAI